MTTRYFSGILFESERDILRALHQNIIGFLQRTRTSTVPPRICFLPSPRLPTSLNSSLHGFAFKILQTFANLFGDLETR